MLQRLLFEMLGSGGGRIKVRESPDYITFLKSNLNIYSFTVCHYLEAKYASQLSISKTTNNHLTMMGHRLCLTALDNIDHDQFALSLGL